MKCQSGRGVDRSLNTFVYCGLYCKGNDVRNVFKKVFSKTFPQESVNNLFNPESYILTQRKIYAYNTQIKNSIVLKKNPISLYIACMEINKKKTQGEDRKKK